MTNKNSFTKRFAVLVAALLVVSSASSIVLAAASSTVTLENTTSETTDSGTVNVAFDVNATDATYNVSLNKIEAPDGTTKNLSSTIEAGTVATVHTDDGTDDSSNVYTNLTGSTDLPLNGTITLYYSQNGTSYTDTVTYDFDADDDGVADSNDKYPSDAPTTFTVNASDNETVASAYVQAENGSLDATVYGVDTDGNQTKVGSGTFTVGSTEELAEVTVDNGTYTQYDIEVHSNATITDHGLICESNTGGGTNDGSSSPDPAVVGGIALLVLGGVIFVLRD